MYEIDYAPAEQRLASGDLYTRHIEKADDPRGRLREPVQ